MHYPYILIAEDDEDSVILIDLVLKEINPDVNWKFTKSCGDTMKHINVREEKPVLVIISLSDTPNAGLELLKTLKEDETMRVIPVVFYTTSSDPVDVKIANGLSCDGYYTKEFDLEDMKAALGDMLATIKVEELSF